MSLKILPAQKVKHVHEQYLAGKNRNEIATTLQEPVEHVDRYLTAALNQKRTYGHPQKLPKPVPLPFKAEAPKLATPVSRPKGEYSNEGSTYAYRNFKSLLERH